MTDRCDECGKELDSRDVRVFEKKKYCDDCLSKKDPNYAPPQAKTKIPGAGASSALKVFAWLSIIGGIIAGFSFGDDPSIGVAVIGAGILYGVLLLGFAAMIQLLRGIYEAVRK